VADWKALVFDFDGTLVDSYALIHEHTMESAAKVLGVELKEFLKDNPYADFWHFWSQVDFNVFPRQITPERVQEMKVEMADVREESLSQAKFFPDSQALFDLKDHDVRMAVASYGFSERLEKELEKQGLDCCIECVVGRDFSLDRSKRLDQAVQLMGADKQSCLYVGDMPQDVLAGQKSSVDTVVVVRTRNFQGTPRRVVPEESFKKKNAWPLKFINSLHALPRLLEF
jgi:phosphoglycolate phosphatase-like HAD superfamily hydrolase